MKSKLNIQVRIPEKANNPVEGLREMHPKIQVENRQTYWDEQETIDQLFLRIKIIIKKNINK